MIQIQQPEIEALIQQRLVDGGFTNVEAVLKQALTDAPLPLKTPATAFTTADMLDALQRMPYKDLELDPGGVVCPVSDPVEF
jgi:hypothetical protein